MEEKTQVLEFRWTVSRGRETYGYNICTLYVDGTKVARCNGGGYDMEGTCLGNFIAGNYGDRLRRRISAEPIPCDACEGRGYFADADGSRMQCNRCEGQGKRVPEFYGLTFHDPNYDPGKAVVGTDTVHDRTLGGAEGMTVEQAEAAGKSMGLERYQAFYAASAPFPTERHTAPRIDGACGMRSVEKIAQAIGLTVEYIDSGKRSTRRSLYVMRDTGANAGESR